MAYPASGSFAEYAKASTDMIALKPRNLSHSEASVLPLVGECQHDILNWSIIYKQKHELTLVFSIPLGLTVVQAFEDNNLREGKLSTKSFVVLLSNSCHFIVFTVYYHSFSS